MPAPKNNKYAVKGGKQTDTQLSIRLASEDKERWREAVDMDPDRRKLNRVIIDVMNAWADRVLKKTGNQDK